MVVANGQPFLRWLETERLAFFAKRPFSTNHFEKEGNGRLYGPMERNRFIRTAPQESRCNNDIKMNVFEILVRPVFHKPSFQNSMHRLQ